ncbi:hypothetical protein [Methylophaga sp.]|uniref:hypothetical protein n=1 Tax=Methylophaga sp. TaxID=2024840 RepID=UPI0025EB7740|nr:hypothetical protein [Methylophaga sp.]
MITIRDLMTDKQLFGDQFNADSWQAWRTLLAGFEGLPLDNDELALWETLTGRTQAPDAPADELWLVVGRRGGKSQQAAVLAVREACFRDHAAKLSPGEVATVLVISADRKQARTVFRYVSGLFHSNPMLERLIVREDKESIELSNRTVIEIGTASFRSTRGYTLAAVICDEVAFWRSDESANPDAEIINALRPALATLNGKLIALSSPYAKRGELWNAYRRYFGQQSQILVAKAPSKLMNPTLPDKVIEQAKERDLAAAMAEYEAEFRNDIQSFIDVNLLNQLTRSEPATLPPDRRHRYKAFVDPSGGGADGFALCIGHREQSGRIVIDLVTERIRTNPAQVVEEYAGILYQYNGLKMVTGDRYAGEWVANEFKRNGINYQYSEMNRSELYLEMLQMLNAGRVELPPDDRLIHQFQNLERRTSRSGRDTIDHPPGLHDDRANAAAGLAVTLAAKPPLMPAPRWE